MPARLAAPNRLIAQRGITERDDIQCILNVSERPECTERAGRCFHESFHACIDQMTRRLPCVAGVEWRLLPGVHAGLSCELRQVVHPAVRTAGADESQAA
jgi:hypothetical protein